MEYVILFTSFAENEYISAFQFYEDKQNGLGLKFETETSNLIEHLKQNPHQFQRKYKHYREAVYKKSPYFLIYEILDKKVIIHSVFNAKQNPKRKLNNKK